MQFLRFAMSVAALCAAAGCAATQDAPRPPKAIPDAEPDVTAQLRATLLGFGDGSITPSGFTDKAAGILFPDQARAYGAALRACRTLTALELLERKVFGENREYLYRAPCQGRPLLVNVVFGKSGRIDRLTVAPE